MSHCETHTQNTMAGWLNLHGVSVSMVKGFLDRSDAAYFPKASHVAVGNHDLGLDAPAAWTMCACALKSAFPAQADAISDVEANVSTTFEKSATPYRQPFTYHPPDAAFPEVSVHYQGTAADLLAVAHEFTHAFQIHVARRTFVAPVLREVCAFIGELCLMRYLLATRSSHVAAVIAAWESDNEIYLSCDTNALLAALSKPNARYCYHWNYPLARHIAQRLFERGDTEIIWSIMSGDETLCDCIARLATEELETRLDNYLPSVPENDPDRPALNAYRSLGIMALLDIDHWEGQSQQSIDTYFQTALGHLQTGTLHIALDDDRKPVGYATWQFDPESDGQAYLTRQAAPFGDHLALQKSLQDRLPAVSQLFSQHSRSARKEQVAWQT